jgi:membrane-bound lytic murein transglycosylase D
MKKSLSSLAVLFGSILTLLAQESVFKPRLDLILSKVPLTYNSYVESYINAFLADQTGTETMLGKGRIYLKGIDEILVRSKLPKELKYLPAALSAFQVALVSEDGGSGFWQMRYHVAKSNELHISSYVDERRDYKAATVASVKYLEELFLMYESWPLTLAAFYGDPVEVNKAIRLAGGSLDYWKIHPFLPEKYQSTVPKFIATVYIFTYYKEHRLTPDDFTIPNLDTVAVLQWTTLQQIGRALEMDPNLLLEWNPIFKKKVIPYSGNPYLLRLPFDKARLFRALGDTVYSFGREVIEQDTTSKETPDSVEVVESDPKPPKPVLIEKTAGEILIYHTVRSGEFLGKIADLYDCNVKELRKWNNMRNDRINSGQKLKIYIPAGKKSQYQKINKMTAAEKKRIIQKD